MMIDAVNVNVERDVLDLVPVEFNGHVINLKRGGSHGYWTVHYPKGRIPKELEGSYTNKSLAEQAVTNYLKTLKPHERASTKST